MKHLILCHIVSVTILCESKYFRVLFFCKQKTAYEMRISDWSSDVCASDLAKAAAAQADATRDSVLISAAAKGAFPDTATGIAGTVSGDYFYAASGVAPDKTVGLYLNDAGLAVKQSDLATSGDITSLDTRVTTAETDRKSTRLNSSH